MRSAVLAAALAAGALAVPHQKRDVVTDVDTNVVYVTDVVTVTGGAPQATTTAASAAQHYGGGKHKWHWTWTSEWTSEATSTEAPTTEAPPPSSTTTEAPAPTSTTEAPAPTSTEETSTWSSPSPKSTEQPTNTGSSGSTPTSYQEITVYHHNLHRQNHSAPNIEWSDSLAQSAATIAASCVYAHNT